MKDGTKIAKIFGIEIKLHYSWWLIFVLLSWSLATAFFPANFTGYDKATYWLMGIAASLLLFVSVLLHELSHSLVAKSQNINVSSITLFFFGGVAGIESEDMKPWSEFIMALAGPLFSLLLSGFFFVLFSLDIFTPITSYLYQLNLILALFNLVPGYPLDGGRAFRALLHAYYKDLRKATWVASRVGKIFAGILVIFGFLGLFTKIGGGLWFVLIGTFLYFIAESSYSQVVIKQILEPLKVKQLMRAKFVKIAPNILFSDFVGRYANAEDNLFLVTGADFTGILDADRIPPISPARQKMITLRALAMPLNKLIAVKSSDSAYSAFKMMNQAKMTVIPVVKNGKLIGILSQRMLLNRVAWDLKFGQQKNSKINH